MGELQEALANLRGRASASRRRTDAATRPQEGSHEPDELRGSSPDLWGTGGEIPPVYPASAVIADPRGGRGA